MKTRLSWGIGGVVVGLVTTLVASGGPVAVAANNDPILAGTGTQETFGAYLWNINATSGCGSTGDRGFTACGNPGVVGVADGNNTFTPGVEGDNSGGGPGVLGDATGAGGAGLYGLATVSSGTGVYGEGNENGVHAQGGTFGVFAEGSDYGVYASAPNHGVYGQAKSSTGVGVEAVSSSGTALKVTGKAKFSRSGITTIAAGTSSKTISLAGVTTASMVLATAQQNATVYVKAVVPAGGSFSIRLTGNAPTGGLKVAYFVLN